MGWRRSAGECHGRHVDTDHRFADGGVHCPYVFGAPFVVAELVRPGGLRHAQDFVHREHLAQGPQGLAFHGGELRVQPGACRVGRHRLARGRVQVEIHPRAPVNDDLLAHWFSFHPWRGGSLPQCAGQTLIRINPLPSAYFLRSDAQPVFTAAHVPIPDPELP